MRHWHGWHGHRSEASCGVYCLYTWEGLSLAIDTCSNLLFSKDNALVDDERFRRKSIDSSSPESSTEELDSKYD